MNKPCILSDPAVMGGKPCVAGTRFPVARLLAELEDRSLREVCDDFELDFDTCRSVLAHVAGRYAKRVRRVGEYEARECSTLGTNFRDIYENGELFAAEVDFRVAEWAVANPEVFLGNVNAPTTRLRRDVLEREWINWNKRVRQ